MNTNLKEARSGVANENIQEMLDAEANPNNLTMTGQAQYLTPPGLADYCTSLLPERSPATVIDPQCGEGALLKACYGWNVTRFGVDIDNRLPELSTQYRAIIGNFVKFAEELYPDLTWVAGVANPPFGKRWKTENGVVDSTDYTWKWLLRHCRYGYLIASAKTIEALNINTHPWVYKYETRPGAEYWDGVNINIGIVWWQNPNPPTATMHPHLFVAFDKLREILDEERNNRPPFNIYLDSKGYLRTYLSLRSEVKLNLTHIDRGRLYRVDKAHPLSLTTEKETRDLLRELVEKGIYTFQPEAKAAIEKALAEVNALACPIMPVTPFESVAYADEEETLLCIRTVASRTMEFTAGKKYSISTGSYKFSQKFIRKKLHFDEKTLQSYSVDHTCMLAGQDRYIQVIDDHGRRLRFMDRPHDGVSTTEFEEKMLWTIFQQPVVPTIAETRPEAVAQNAAVLRSCEMLAGFGYYPGQLRYLSRVAAKDQALIAAATGAGKTLMCISLLAQKQPERALIIAPQGTMRSSEDEDDDDEGEQMMNASQWIQEINRFAPYLQIWELFSYADYQRICSQNRGKLPPGVYVTYYQAFFQNGARETAAASWDDDKLAKMAKTFGATLPKAPDGAGRRYWCDTIGKEKEGIRCILQPCLSTLIGDQFDLVAVDEAHICTNLDANVTQMLIRLQPKYRYAFTATPIPNIVSNLFSLMGWLAVPEWYKGKRRNAAWPYSREELSRFNNTFLSTERDFTQEDINRQRDKYWNGKCVKTSPVIAAPARLLKLLKPTMSYISKADCNPDYKEPRIVDVRVPLGHQQARLYAWFLDRAHIPASHPLVRARKQVAWLRAICADPVGFRHTDMVPHLKVVSNMNPKVIAILELVKDILSQGEQVVIINSRIGLTDTIQQRLVDAGIPIARIDSTVTADEHAKQANLFKAGKARVMLMGIKCAASHSFDQCRFEIIGSIEYSPGPFNQAKGRIDRVNSRPDVQIYCILHKGTIEEVMFDLVATKDDAATICLKGQRVPREFKPVDPAEIMATAFNAFDLTGSTPESQCESKWPDLCKAIAKTRNVPPALTQVLPLI